MNRTHEKEQTESEICRNEKKQIQQKRSITETTSLEQRV